MAIKAIGKAYAAVASLVLASILVVPSVQAIPLLGNLANGIGGGYGGTPDSGDTFATGNAALNISDIDVLWTIGNHGTNNRVGIFTDAGGLPSGNQVGTWFTSGLATTSSTTIDYIGNATLAANTNYHLVIDILDASRAAYTFNTAFFADLSTLGASNAIGSEYGNIQAVTWHHDPANLVWQLNGATNAVPEPASLFLLGLGLAALGFSRRHQA